jgi:hypothetical protein
MMLLIGCGGSNQEVTTEEPTQEAAKEAEPAKLTGAAGELANLMTLKGNLEYQITYDVTTNAGGEEMKSTMIQYFDGADRFRTDITVKGVSEMRTYVIGETATSCFKMNNKWTCNTAEGYTDESLETEENIAEGMAGYAVTADGTKQLLGKTHNCYKVTDSVNSATMRYCFSSDGVPVYISMTSPEATTEMTALLYGKDVAENVWVIPT